MGSVLGILIAAAGGIVALRNSDSSTRMGDPAVRRRYYLVVGLEFGILIAGAIWLNASGHGSYTPAWVCAGVGLHFLPLSRVLDDPSLVPLGILITGAATAAVGAFLVDNVAQSTVTGIGAGVLLALFGLLNLVRTPGSSRRAVTPPRASSGPDAHLCDPRVPVHLGPGPLTVGGPRPITLVLLPSRRCERGRGTLAARLRTCQLRPCGMTPLIAAGEVAAFSNPVGCSPAGAT